MSDYLIEAQMLRGEMARHLAGNEEQFLYVLSTALCDVDVADVIAQGRLSEDATPEDTVRRLRQMADAIEAGEVS